MFILFNVYGWCFLELGGLPFAWMAMATLNWRIIVLFGQATTKSTSNGKFSFVLFELIFWYLKSRVCIKILIKFKLSIIWKWDF